MLTEYMGNANGREGGAGLGSEYPAMNLNPPSRVTSSDSMGNSPPDSPGRSRSPLMFNPQVFLVLANFDLLNTFGILLLLRSRIFLLLVSRFVVIAAVCYIFDRSE